MDNGQFYSSLGVVWVFGFVVVMLIAWHLRSKRQLEKLKIIHEERMKAMEQGIPLPTTDPSAPRGAGCRSRRRFIPAITMSRWLPGRGLPGGLRMCAF